MMVSCCRLKDDLTGEIPVAFVKRIDGSEITEAEIKQFVAKEVTNATQVFKCSNICVC